MQTSQPRLIKRVEKSTKPIDNRVSISAETLRAYLLERRRALLTELRELNRLLGITTE